MFNQIYTFFLNLCLAWAVVYIFQTAPDWIRIWACFVTYVITLLLVSVHLMWQREEYWKR